MRPVCKANSRGWCDCGRAADGDGRADEAGEADGRAAAKDGRLGVGGAGQGQA